MKTCKRCKHTKPLSDFTPQTNCAGGYRPECKACRTRSKDIERKRHLKRAYNMSLEDYADLLAAQNGGCAICGDPPPAGKVLHVDHNHHTGTVRGLLCQSCNTMLGGAKDAASTLAKGIVYLEN